MKLMSKNRMDELVGKAVTIEEHYLEERKLSSDSVTSIVKVKSDEFVNNIPSSSSIIKPEPSEITSGVSTVKIEPDDLMIPKEKANTEPDEFLSDAFKTEHNEFINSTIQLSSSKFISDTVYMEDKKGAVKIEEHAIYTETQSDIEGVDNEEIQSFKSPVVTSDMKKHKQLICILCDYKAKRTDCLKKHMLIHKHPSEINWFKCDTCSFKTKVKSSLTRHTLIHKQHLSDVKLFKCDLCNFKTTRKYYLKTHNMLHEEPAHIRWFKCEACDYTTKQRCNLKCHMSIHEGIKLFKCDFCCFKSKHKVSLRRHLTVIHKQNPLNRNCFEYEIRKSEPNYGDSNRGFEPLETERFKKDLKSKWKKCFSAEMLAKNKPSATK
ncbi:hypothetical protein NQ315_015270 [Exocentrus adspersus]|uniref:Protein hunchback n=1 Tax=Exocentrus adspersus TaxID=1586481 RepID=A0AAV8VAM4_9CUCU|nr:hypothetical protein NQ315_015270 [Exocentrus adspersus]